MYTLDTTGANDVCVICSSLINGCSICDNSTHCMECSAGFFLNQTFNNLCESCNVAIEGCLFCESAASCDLCDTEYYGAGGLCHRCDSAMDGCFSCKQFDVCTSCKGGYDIAFGGGCELIDPSKVEEYLTEGDITITTYYISDDILMHALRVKGGPKFKKATVDWDNEVQLFIEVTTTG